MAQNNIRLTPQEEQNCEAIVAQMRLKFLARQIRDNKHLAKVLQDADVCLRKQVYEEIKPHLRFKPKPYFLLMKK